MAPSSGDSVAMCTDPAASVNLFYDYRNTPLRHVEYLDEMLREDRKNSAALC